MYVLQIASTDILLHLSLLYWLGGLLLSYYYVYFTDEKIKANTKKD